jgi:hypothetical protein
MVIISPLSPPPIGGGLKMHFFYFLEFVILFRFIILEIQKYVLSVGYGNGWGSF